MSRSRLAVRRSIRSLDRRPLSMGEFFACMITLILAFSSQRLAAQGLVRSELAQVEAHIVDGTATVELEQTLRNEGSRPAEAVWVLPIPRGVSVDRFQMQIGDKTYDGEIHSAGTAQRVYEQIVRRRRDPGLLEYVDDGLLRARIFPIPAGGTATIRVGYREVMEPTLGVFHFEFPVDALAVGGYVTSSANQGSVRSGGVRPDRISLQVTVESKRSLQTVYSPSKDFEIVREDDHHAQASYEVSGAEASGRLELFFSNGENSVGLDLLSHKEGDEGQFLLLLTPQLELDDSRRTPRAVQFVIDTSGSMKGEKIRQARASLEQFVQSLEEDDYFDIVPFAGYIDSFFGRPVRATKKNRAVAIERIQGIEARGGTNIEGALGHAFTHSMPKPAEFEGEIEPLPVVVFLTDGLPSIGEQDPRRLLVQSLQNNEQEARVFVFGVGSDVNTRLLDDLAWANRGERSYVREGEDIEIETSALFEKLGYPAMTDVEIAFESDVEGLRVFGVEPQVLPDLFRGSRLSMLGAYEGGGPATVVVRGKVAGVATENRYDVILPAKQVDHDFVPVLWAKRQVAVLIEQIARNGADEELLAEVKRLTQEYGLVTQLTSALIVEDERALARQLGLPEPSEIVSDSDDFFLGNGRESGDGGLRLPHAQSGDVAIEVSEGLRRLREARSESGLSEDWVRGRPRPRVYRGPGQPVPPPPGGPGGGGPATRGPAGAGPSGPATGPSSPATGGGVGRSGGPGGTYRGPGDSTPPGSEARREAETRRGPQARRVGSRTFVVVGETWVDRSFNKEEGLPKTAVVAYSDAYFEWLRKLPELSRVFSLGDHVLVVVEVDDQKQVLELVPAPEESEVPAPEEPAPSGSGSTGSRSTGR